MGNYLIESVKKKEDYRLEAYNYYYDTFLKASQGLIDIINIIELKNDGFTYEVTFKKRVNGEFNLIHELKIKNGGNDE